MSSPLQVQNLTLTGNWQEITIPSDYVAFSLQARGANDLLIAQKDRTSDYYTIKSGTSFSMSSGNFSSGNSSDIVMVKGTADDVCEVAGQIRS